MHFSGNQQSGQRASWSLPSALRRERTEILKYWVNRSVSLSEVRAKAALTLLRAGNWFGAMSSLPKWVCVKLRW